MSDPLASFIGLSAVLTGFAADEIGDPLDPDQLASVYLDVVKGDSRYGAMMAAFAQAQAESGGDPDKLVAAVRALIFDDARLGSLARNVTRLWYLGRWQGTYVSDPRLGAPDAPYIRALAWKAMNTKAIGYSEFTDQYWARAPREAGKP